MVRFILKRIVSIIVTLFIVCTLTFAMMHAVPAFAPGTLIPAVTCVGPMIAGIMTGSFATEKIFAIPGMGKFFVKALPVCPSPAACTPRWSTPASWPVGK